MRYPTPPAILVIPILSSATSAKDFAASAFDPEFLPQRTQSLSQRSQRGERGHQGWRSGTRGTPPSDLNPPPPRGMAQPGLGPRRNEVKAGESPIAMMRTAAPSRAPQFNVSARRR